MQVIASELLGEAPRNVKFLLNDHTLAFFPSAQQHRDFKLFGLSYEDDYRGNALAGLVIGDHVEIRFHTAYSAERVATIWGRARTTAELTGLQISSVVYQGQVLF